MPRCALPPTAMEMAPSFSSVPTVCPYAFSGTFQLSESLDPHPSSRLAKLGRSLTTDLLSWNDAVALRVQGKAKAKGLLLLLLLPSTLLSCKVARKPSTASPMNETPRRSRPDKGVLCPTSKRVRARLRRMLQGNYEICALLPSRVWELWVSGFRMSELVKL